MIRPISYIQNTSYIPRLQGARAWTLASVPRRAAMPETPVTPVRAAPATSNDTAPAVRAYRSRQDLSSPMWTEFYPIEQANRVRVQISLPGAVGTGENTDRSAAGFSQAFRNLDWPLIPGADSRELAVRMRIQYPGSESGGEDWERLPGYQKLPGASQLPGAEEEEAKLGAEGAQEAAEDGRCQTCEERKYQDGSDDSSVSFQTPTHIDPDAAQAAVRGHELEHVSHEQAKAQREGRKVVSQTVTMHTDICPECGRVYISGGTTRTVTKKVNDQPVESNSYAGAEK